MRFNRKKITRSTLFLIALGSYGNLMALHVPIPKAFTPQNIIAADTQTQANRRTRLRTPFHRAIAIDRRIENYITKIFAESLRGAPHIDARKLARFTIAESRKHNFDPFFILCVISAESAFDNHAVSNVGAVGLMQLMPRTARAIHRNMDLDEYRLAKLFDPYINIQLGIHYLAKLKRRFGHNVVHYLAAYNEGPTRIAKRLRQKRRVRSRYAKKILSYYHFLANQPATKPYLAEVL